MESAQMADEILAKIQEIMKREPSPTNGFDQINNSTIPDHKTVVTKNKTEAGETIAETPKAYLFQQSKAAMKDEI